jgi:hypothetical protein
VTSACARRKSRLIVVGRASCLICALRRVLSKRQLDRLHDELHEHGHVVYYARAKDKHSKRRESR